MLTKSDLRSIGELFDKRFDAAFDRKFDAAFDKKFKPIRKDMKIIKNKLEQTVRFFDLETLGIKKRIKTLEEHPFLKLKQV